MRTQKDRIDLWTDRGRKVGQIERGALEIYITMYKIHSWWEPAVLQETSTWCSVMIQRCGIGKKEVRGRLKREGIYVHM